MPFGALKRAKPLAAFDAISQLVAKKTMSFGALNQDLPTAYSELLFDSQW